MQVKDLWKKLGQTSMICLSHDAIAINERDQENDGSISRPRCHQTASLASNYLPVMDLASVPFRLSLGLGFLFSCQPNTSENN